MTLLGFVGPEAALAQSIAVVDPTTLQFTASADHATLTRYELEVVPESGASPVAVLNLGKPVPGADGQIRVELSAWRLSATLAAGVYFARVSATSEGGTSVSPGSNTFTFSAAACSYTLGSSSASYSAASGAGSISLTTGPACSWTATTAATWITLSGASGSGDGTVRFAVLANPSTTVRTGTMTIGPRTFTVTQAGTSGGCTYAISPATRSIAAAASTERITITTASGCAWTALTGANWITLGSATGPGPGSVAYTVSANSTASSRTGTLTIAGQTATLTQTGIATPHPVPAPTPTPSPTPHRFPTPDAPPSSSSCTDQFCVSSVTMSAAGGSGHVYVTTTGASCAWTTTRDAAWVALGAASGSGTGPVMFTMAANTTLQK